MDRRWLEQHFKLLQEENKKHHIQAKLKVTYSGLALSSPIIREAIKQLTSSGHITQWLATWKPFLAALFPRHILQGVCLINASLFSI